MPPPCCRPAWTRSPARRLREIIVADGGSSDATAADRRRRRRPGARGAARAGTATRRRHRRRRAATGCCCCTPTRAWHPAGGRRPARAWRGRRRAGYFRFALDSADPRARRLERLVAWRCRRLGLPYGDQGLLIPRALLDAVGGVRPLPLMEDVDLARRLGRAPPGGARRPMRSTSARALAARRLAAAFGAQPRLPRLCITAGVPPRIIARLYA